MSAVCPLSDLIEVDRRSTPYAGVRTHAGLLHARVRGVNASLTQYSLRRFKESGLLATHLTRGLGAQP